MFHHNTLYTGNQGYHKAYTINIACNRIVVVHSSSFSYMGYNSIHLCLLFSLELYYWTKINETLNLFDAMGLYVLALLIQCWTYITSIGICANNTLQRVIDRWHSAVHTTLGNNDVYSQWYTARSPTAQVTLHIRYSLHTVRIYIVIINHAPSSRGIHCLACITEGNLTQKL